MITRAIRFLLMGCLTARYGFWPMLPTVLVVVGVDLVWLALSARTPQHRPVELPSDGRRLPTVALVGLNCSVWVLMCVLDPGLPRSPLGSVILALGGLLSVEPLMHQLASSFGFSPGR